MSTSAPRVTALVAAYNASAFIEETLHSIANQSYPNLSILISVDVSNDDTARRCEQFALADQRFTVVYQTQRLGWIQNANELLRLAQSDLCFFIGHDDLIDQEYVSSLVTALTQNNQASIAYSDMTFFHSEVQEVTVVCEGLDGITEPLTRGRVVLQWIPGWWASYRGLFRLNIARAGRPLRSHLGGEYAADWPFLMYFALRGECIRVRRVLYRKRSHAASLSSTWRYGPLQRMCVSLSCAQVILEADLKKKTSAVLLTILASRLTYFLLRFSAGRVLQQLRKLRTALASWIRY
jgi:glycosyltransferase involved in cell wall biosynthesis